MSPRQHDPRYPKPRQIYTLEQITNLPLDDIECLNIVINGREHPVQTSHINHEDMFSNCPNLRNSFWRYEYTTDEWVPVFTYAGNEDQLHLLFDWYPSWDYISNKFNLYSLWVTPKGSPRLQYAGDLTGCAV